MKRICPPYIPFQTPLNRSLRCKYSQTQSMLSDTVSKKMSTMSTMLTEERSSTNRNNLHSTVLTEERGSSNGNNTHSSSVVLNRRSRTSNSSD